MRLIIISVSAILAFFMLSGALGLRTSEECESDPSITRNSERMNCYYASAITAAYLCGRGQQCDRARDLCEEIWVRFGAPLDPDTGSDQRKKAELVANQCYFEISKITAYPPMCEYITQRDNTGSQLFGDVVTKEACFNVTGNLAQLMPENYNSNPNNLCAIVFVLPMFVGGALILTRRP